MHHLNPNKAGMAFGSLVSLGHIVWSLLVAFGWAQSYLDFVFGLHMIQNPFTVQAFSAGKALALIVLTFVVGYIIGLVFAHIWNKLHTVQA